jgi:hypothetical protein
LDAEAIVIEGAGRVDTNTEVYGLAVDLSDRGLTVHGLRAPEDRRGQGMNRPSGVVWTDSLTGQSKPAGPWIEASIDDEATSPIRQERTFCMLATRHPEIRSDPAIRTTGVAADTGSTITA